MNVVYYVRSSFLTVLTLTFSKHIVADKLQMQKLQLFLTITRLQQEIKATTLTYIKAISHLYPS